MDKLIEIFGQIENSWGTIMTIFTIIIVVISLYYKIKSNFTSVISGFIKEAEEDTSLSNPEKMNMVISWIKNLIPRIFQVVFNDKVLRQIAENIYQDMKAYRNAYIKNKTGLETSKLVEALETTKEKEDDGK